LFSIRVPHLFVDFTAPNAWPQIEDGEFARVERPFGHAPADPFLADPPGVEVEQRSESVDGVESGGRSVHA
jgi:hypothetical protein